jgi:hypothetical protein
MGEALGGGVDVDTVAAIKGFLPRILTTIGYSLQTISSTF